MDYPADQALLTRLRAGEQKAYRELVATYRGVMRAVAFANACRCACTWPCVSTADGLSSRCA